MIYMHFHWPPCPHDVLMLWALLGTYVQFIVVWMYRVKMLTLSFFRGY